MGSEARVFAVSHRLRCRPRQRVEIPLHLLQKRRWLVVTRRSFIIRSNHQRDRLGSKISAQTVYIIQHSGA